jgi:hypothetical protein
MEISPCGVDCEQCREYTQSCKGCRAISGKVFWAGYMNLTVCPIYQCCIDENSFQHCGTCGKLPCKIHYDIKDPAISDEEHEAGIQERVKILKAISSN